MTERQSDSNELGYPEHHRETISGEEAARLSERFSAAPMTPEAQVTFRTVRQLWADFGNPIDGFTREQQGQIGAVILGQFDNLDTKRLSNEQIKIIEQQIITYHEAQVISDDVRNQALAQLRFLPSEEI